MAEKPDAILYPGNIKKGRSQVDRLTYAQQLFGPVLGGDQHTSLGAEHGGRVYSREVGDGLFLATLNADDSLLFPATHEYAYLPRYRWEDQGEGVKFGWLLTAEDMEQQSEGETPAQKQNREMSAEAVKKANADLHDHHERWRVLTSLGERRTAEETEELRKLRAMPAFSRRLKTGTLEDPFPAGEHDGGTHAT